MGVAVAPRGRSLPQLVVEGLGTASPGSSWGSSCSVGMAAGAAGQLPGAHQQRRMRCRGARPCRISQGCRGRQRPSSGGSGAGGILVNMAMTVSSTMAASNPLLSKICSSSCWTQGCRVCRSIGWFWKRSIPFGAQYNTDNNKLYSAVPYLPYPQYPQWLQNNKNYTIRTVQSNAYSTYSNLHATYYKTKYLRKLNTRE